jgi:RHS repeat-associated protein
MTRCCNLLGEAKCPRRWNIYFCAINRDQRKHVSPRDLSDLGRDQALQGPGLGGYQYDAFGNIPFSFATGYSGPAPTDDILFTGKDLDPDTGLYYFNARWYDAGLGRYVTRTIFRADNEHSYVYCENDPIRLPDPSGLFRWGDLLPGVVGGDHSLGLGGLLCAKRIGKIYWEQFAGSIHHEEPHDSYVHCLVSCEIARYCGQAAAVAAGRVQESGNDWNTHRDTQDDEVANALGRSIAAKHGKNSDCCQKECEKAFYDKAGGFRP